MVWVEGGYGWLCGGGHRNARALAVQSVGGPLSLGRFREGTARPPSAATSDSGHESTPIAGADPSPPMAGFRPDPWFEGPVKGVPSVVLVPCLRVAGRTTRAAEALVPAGTAGISGTAGVGGRGGVEGARALGPPVRAGRNRSRSRSRELSGSARRSSGPARRPNSASGCRRQRRRGQGSPYCVTFSSRIPPKAASRANCWAAGPRRTSQSGACRTVLPWHQPQRSRRSRMSRRPPRSRRLRGPRPGPVRPGTWPG